MNKRYLLSPLYLMLCLVLIAAQACGKAKPPDRDIKPHSSSGPKRVMVLPFIDNSGLGKGAAEQATAGFVDLLSKSSHVTLQRPSKDMVLPDHADSPKYGIVTPPQLIKKAEALGLDALIMGVVDPPAGITKRKGIWPFRSSRRIYEVSAMICVMHVPSRTVLLTAHEMEKTSFVLEKSSVEKELARQALGETLPDVLETLASAVSKSLAGDLSHRLRFGK